jgi:hypothetical protein
MPIDRVPERLTDYDYDHRYNYDYGLDTIVFTLGAQAQTDTATVAQDADLIQSAVEWRLRVDGDVVDQLYDVSPLVDTANPFGDYVVLKLDDQGGELFDRFRRGTRVEVDISTNFGLSFTNRFTGFVVERRETEQAGADALEVEAYSFDQFLRKNTVTNDQSGKTLANALQDIVETDTPVSFVADNIEVGNPQTVQETLRGRKVENVLQGLAFASTGEEFGVNDDLEFFFRPSESVHIERGIDNTQWFNYDIPELGKDVINEVEVFFDSGNESVVVDRGKSKLDLQNELGLPDPATERKELNRDDIQTFSGAKRVGEQFLEFRNTVLTGTVTTFSLFDARPGDTIDISIEARGIDDEFRIAELDYKWGRDETTLTIVEKRSQDIDTDILRVSEKVDRIEQRGANRDGVQNRITTTDVAATITPSAVVDNDSGGQQKPPKEDDRRRLTNGGRNLIRDAFAGKSVPGITDIALGQSNQNLSRSNTELEDEIVRKSVQGKNISGTKVTFDALFSQSNIKEAGLFAGQTLVTRLTLDEPADPLGDAEITLEVGNDATVDRGVFTIKGQKVVRDILADNSPDLPAEYAYGRGQSAPAESDTALDDQAASLSLDEIVVQTADTNSDFNSITPTFADTTPLAVQNGAIELLQAGFFREGENMSNLGASTFSNRPNASQGEFVGIKFATDFVEFSFTNEYDIPANDVQFAFRLQTEASDTPAFSVKLDGSTIFSLPTDGLGPNKFKNQFAYLGPRSAGLSSDLSAGSHTLRFEIDQASSNTSFVFIDLGHLSDARFPYTFDNSTDSDDNLEGPQLFPDLQTVEFDASSTLRIVNSVTASEDYNDVSNNQFIEVSNDGGATFQRFNNTSSATGNFQSGGQSPQARLGLSRFGSRTTASPSTGFNGQTVSTHELVAGQEGIVPNGIGSANVRAIARTGDLSAESDQLTEGGQLDAQGDLLTRSIFPSFPIGSQTRVESSEETRFTRD